MIEMVKLDDGTYIPRAWSTEVIDGGLLPCSDDCNGSCSTCIIQSLLNEYAIVTGQAATNETREMTKRELWLRLFSENDAALATAIHLCERFVGETGLDEKGRNYVNEQIKALNRALSKDEVAAVFGAVANKKGT